MFVYMDMEKEVFIFDLDDTLLETPTFVSFLEEENGIIKLDGDYLSFFLSVKSKFIKLFSIDILFRKEGDFILICDSKTNQHLGEDIYKKIINLNLNDFLNSDLKKRDFKSFSRMIELKEGKLILTTFQGFHSDPKTIGKKINNAVIDFYLNSLNKIILTGRGEKLRLEIEDRLMELELKNPNFGLFLFPGGENTIEDFKINTIINSIEENNWEIVHFFEDNKKWLEATENAVKIRFPKVKFLSHYIDNVKKMHSF